MIIQMFTHYLLESGLLTSEQIPLIADARTTIRPSLLDLALEAGYMSEQDLEEYNKIAKPGDSFEDLAVDEGYVTRIQMFDLLRLQARNDMIVIEVLETAGIMEKDRTKAHLAEFRKTYDLSDAEYMKIINSDVKTCLKKIARVPTDSVLFEFGACFLDIAMHCIDNNLVINDYRRAERENFKYVTLIEYTEAPEVPFSCVGYSGSEAVLLEVARKYSPIEINTFGDNCIDSLKELLNCAAGLLAGNMEQMGVDYDVRVPVFRYEETLYDVEILDILTKFGRMQVLFSK